MSWNERGDGLSSNMDQIRGDSEAKVFFFEDPEKFDGMGWVDLL